VRTPTCFGTEGAILMEFINKKRS